VKNPYRFSGKPLTVFGEKPFPRVLQKTFKGFSHSYEKPFRFF
jgi:hypothetical protein